MQRQHRAVLGLGVLMAVAAVLVVAIALPLRSSSVTVMTRNLYLGGDITAPLPAVGNRTGPEALLAFGHANDRLRETVARTDFGVRSALLADEIAAARPDLIGLQEVALWRSGPMQLDQLGRPNATEVRYDFLQLLLAALDERAAGYDVVHEQAASDVEAPAFRGPLTSAVDAQDVRLTVRDVILVRRGSEVRVQDSGGGTYDRQLEVDLAGVRFRFVRGYAWADIAAGRARFRFLTTHLESQSADVALAQAEELRTGPAADAAGSTVLVCDCNSDPARDTVRPGDSVPHSAAYQRLTGAGFEDQWLQQTDADAGLTAGLSELVTDPTPAGFTARIDLVLARPAARVSADRGEVTGDDPADRDSGTGLWPSDHAGVVVTLRIR